ncbi:MAG: MurT ligase domain-containing protein [Clostridia bacterium]|nr:MurT ligase domain-containing protein [Clostridia bacterium]
MLRSYLGIAAAKIIRKTLRLMGKGATTLPGKTAIKISPDVIRKSAEGKTIITVTGTNGKTTTSHMISEMLTSLGYEVINNISGANLASGIATTLICDGSKNKNAVYVLETDEAAFAKIAGSLKPTVSVVTNLFRDQLDRYGELTHTRDLIAGGIDKTDATLILNSNDSLVASLGKGRENRTVFFGLNKESMLKNSAYKKSSTVLEASSDAVYCPTCQVKYEYKSRSFSHLGDFCCPKCGFKSPDDRFSVVYDLKSSPSDEGYKFSIQDSLNSESNEVELKIPGSHNLYNTCAAVSAVTVLLEKLNSNSKDSFKSACEASCKVKAAFGRMEKIDIGGKKICILLVKNPAGLDRSLSFVTEASDASSVMFLLNSNIADGKDVSWIWDVDFESKANDLPSDIYVSGERFGDMLLRVTYAGRDIPSEFYGDMSNAMKLVEKALEKCEEGKCVYILPNYTSMLKLREMLVHRFNLKDFWE